MRALLTMKDTLLFLLIRQLYANEKKRGAIMLTKLSPDISKEARNDE